VVISFLMSAAITWRVAEGHDLLRVQKEIDDSAKRFQLEFERETQNLTTLGAWLAKQKELASLLQSRDSARLADYLWHWTHNRSIGSITAVDSAGLVLSRVTVNQLMTQGDNVLEQPGVREALRGESSSGMERDIFGRLQGRCTLPIYDDEQKPPIGVLILGFYLDSDFLKYSGGTAGEGIFIVYQDRIAISTLTDQGGKSWAGQLAPGAVMVAEREARPSEFLTVETNRGKYLFKFTPIQSPTLAVVGMYGVGIPMSTIDSQRAALFQAWGLGLLVAIAVACVVAFLAARIFTSPIRKLRVAARVLAEGDLATPMDLPRSNDELGDLAKQMDNIRHQLAQGRDEFILNVAHELRGPLASLRTSIDLLGEDYAVMSKRDMKMMLQKLQKAAVKFQTLVESLVDVGNIQAGRFRIRPAPTNFHRMLNDAIELIRPLLDTREQQLDVKVSVPDNCTLLVDRPRAIQVIINLLNNASKYGLEGQPIVLSASSKSGFVVIEVTDSGPGIPLEEQAQVFERYYRAKRADEEGVGIGLGLALAKGIVLAHGGQMGVRSRVGEGTTFWFTLPEVQPSEF
jgi:signal transduction histidine kinase